ncbi:MAG: DNA repair protein RecN [Bacteroidetes bacterium]|nr:DNA repair protein RecN [Bacteroidota bacterium]
MLKHLIIKNYAIIDSLEIRFDSQLNIITGETGAGKSIIVGALNMILGKRADPGVLRDPGTKAIIEGSFHIKDLQLEHLFTSLDLDYDTETIIRREILPNGKSRAFVNDSPVTLDKLKNLTGKLVDLHAQHDTAAILNNNFYIAILDRLAGQEDKVKAFKNDYWEFRKKEKELHAKKELIRNQVSDIDYLYFQWNELSELGLTDADGDALEEELNILQNAGTILEHLQASKNMMDDGDRSVVEMITEVSQKISNLAPFSQELANLSTRLDSTLLELSDISGEIETIAGETHLDEDRLAELMERQNNINRLLHKHRLQDVSGLLELQISLRQNLDQLSVSEEDLEHLEKEVAELEEQLQTMAANISRKRLAKTADFVKSISKVLHKVGMKHASVSLENRKSDRSLLSEHGIDDFSMMFSANKGVALQPVKQVASGGERSRLMLSIKSVMAGFLRLPTMIFDEIDTGISGEVAGKVGEVLRSMADNHQVISISHLPQIAAQATAHFYVYKDHANKITETRIRKLDNDNHILEVAKMLSGDEPGEAALTTARELIGV